MNLFDSTGQRKDLNNVERQVFLQETQKQPREVRTFCLVLYYTGCRISEALALTPRQIDFQESTKTKRPSRNGEVVSGVSSSPLITD